MIGQLVSYTAEHPQGLVFFLFAVTVGIALTLLSLRISNLTKGADGKSLENAIRSLHTRVEKLEAHAGKTNAEISGIDRRVTRAVQGVSVERFDPFQNAGGQQSFATALLNEKGDGIVISGIHSRDGVRVYAKEVSGYSSERELSEEESRAIAEAKKKLGV